MEHLVWFRHTTEKTAGQIPHNWEKLVYWGFFVYWRLKVLAVQIGQPAIDVCTTECMYCNCSNPSITHRLCCHLNTFEIEN